MIFLFLEILVSIIVGWSFFMLIAYNLVVEEFKIG